MAIVVRAVLLVLLACLLIGALVGIFASTTGPLEKLVFAAGGVLVLLTVGRVQRIGSHPTAGRRSGRRDRQGQPATALIGAGGGDALGGRAAVLGGALTGRPGEGGGAGLQVGGG